METTMKTPSVLRRAVAVVIFGAFASMSVSGCADYLHDEDSNVSNMDWSRRVTADDVARAEASAKNRAISTNASDTAQARAICTEGSMAECEAACNGGRLAMCITLAQELHAGARVTADPIQADRVLARACNG